MVQLAWKQRSSVLAWLQSIAKLTVIALFLSPSCWAQIPPDGDTTATPVPAAGHDYIHAPLETVNPANGSISIRIPVRMPSGRELTFPFSFAYDSNGADVLADDQAGRLEWLLAGSLTSQGGWSNTAPLLSVQQVAYTVPGIEIDGTQTTQGCGVLVNYVLQDPTGNRHDLDLSIYGTQPPNNGGDCQKGGSNPETVTQGGLAPLFATTTSSSSPGTTPLTVNPVTVTDANGTVYQFPNMSPPGTGGGSLTWMPTSVTDRNGNFITIHPPTGSSSVFSYTDTLGRTVLSDSGFGISPESVTVAGLSSAYTVTWTTLPTPTFTATITSFGTPACQTPTQVARTVVSAITLPNGKQFTFGYDTTYGLLNKITYPSGGYVRYVWGLNKQAEYGEFPNSTLLGVSCAARYDTPAITDRYVSLNGSTEVEHQNFVYTTMWSPSENFFWTNKSTTVTTTDLVRSTSYQTVYNYAPIAPDQAPNTAGGITLYVPVESSVVYNDTTGNLLQTVSKAWANDYTLLGEETQLSNGTSLTLLCYNTNLEVIEKDEYDFGAGSPSAPSACPVPMFPSGSPLSGSALRRTVTNYATFSGTHIVDLPSSVITYNGSLTRVAETDSSYDQSTPQTTSEVQHTTAPGGSARGNLTTATQQCFQGSSACGQGNSTTTNTYYDTGQVYQTTDPNKNVTTYSFTDSYNSCGGTAPSGTTNAYLTKVTYPQVNSVSHIESYCYSYTPGLLLSMTDENSNVTSYTYESGTYSLDRLTQVKYADTGQTLVSYNDTAPTPSVTIQKELTSGQNITSVTTTNGMGLPIETELTSDPSGTDITATAYDGLGNAYTVTNPYRSVSDPTYGVTEYFYDALGRTCLVIPPGGTVPTQQTCPTTAPAGDVLTQYSGNCTTVTDEQGKNRESCTDGLDRLTSIIENPGGLGYTTNYTYDALDDLLSGIEDGSRSRSFSYNSLGQLTQAVNPESGTTSYTYDADGNLLSKTSPAPNQTGSATVTLSYCYDALNRMEGKAYTAQSCPLSSPVATYSYDQTTANGLTVTNGIGRRTSMTDAAGSEAWSYDPMGRVLTDKRTTNSVTNSTVYTYLPYVNGSVANIVYPSGLSLTYTYDGAGRFATAKDQNGNTYAAGSCGTNGVCYAPLGALQTATMDTTSNFAGLAVSNSYTPRLQPNEMKVTNNGTSVMDFSYCFYALSGGACPSTGTTDNGNVMAIINNMDTTRSQKFAYDALNRIYTGASVNTSGTNCWGEQYGLDAWGNLQTMASLSGYSACAQPDNLSVNVTTANQISGYTYDSAGNLDTIPGTGGATYTYNAENQITTSSAGVNYTYDGDGKRVEKSSNPLYWYGTSSDPLEETGFVTNDYIFFGGQRIARRDSSGDVFGYFTDQLGSSRKMEEIASGANAAALKYDVDFYPFGRENAFVGTSSPIYQFTGKIRDDESGLDYFGVRYYSSTIGRFMSTDHGNAGADPANPQSWNMYSYVMDHVLSLIDPFGLDCVYLDNNGGTDPNGPGGAWIDHDSSQGECNNSQGYWANGYIGSLNDVQTFSNNDNALIYSSEGGTVNVSLASQTETQGGFGLGNIPPSFFSGQFADPSYFDQSSFDFGWNRAQVTFSLAYAETVHDLSCVAIPGAGLVSGGAAFSLGQPVPGSKPFVTPGSSLGTSPASSALRDAFPQTMPFRVPTPVGGPGTGTPFRISGTTSPGAAAGRYLPFLGMAMAAYSAYKMNQCLNSVP